MGGRLLNDVARLLADLEETQLAFETLFQRKKSALRRPQPEVLLAVAREESTLVEQLQQHHERREELLEEAGQGGLPNGSLYEVVQAIGGAGAESLCHRMKQIRQMSEKLRREGWVQWVVTQRSNKLFSELLDLIVNQGEHAPTYGRNKQETSTAGSLLDASA